MSRAGVLCSWLVVPNDADSGVEQPVDSLETSRWHHHHAPKLSRPVRGCYWHFDKIH